MNKELLKSKTIWTSIVVAAAGFFPPVQALIISNPEIATSFIGMLFSLLRIKTEVQK